MKILVTGAKGFVGKNLVTELRNRGYQEIWECTRETKEKDLALYTQHCDFIFHLAGVNRPQEEKEFIHGNYDFTAKLLTLLKTYQNKAPILLSSSIQASLDNPYGRSKKAGEDLLLTHEQETGAKVWVYRLPNVFGKWCKPNYNSAVATFCHHIARDLPITVHDPEVLLQLVYIDDVVDEFIQALTGQGHQDGMYCFVPTVHRIKLGDIVDLLHHFKESRQTLGVPQLSNAFTKVLYSTYLSYLPPEEFSYPLSMHVDQRGSFTEIIRTPDRGQFSVNVAKPGITKGNHWHHTKNEKFLVVSGKALIQFRKIGSQEVLSYHVSGDTLEVVDIPPGYTHHITNIGTTDLVTFMWANEAFDPDKPDTYYEEV